jgi:Cu/Ag efflux pump CusA
VNKQERELQEPELREQKLTAISVANDTAPLGQGRDGKYLRKPRRVLTWISALTVLVAAGVAGVWLTIPASQTLMAQATQVLTTRPPAPVATAALVRGVRVLAVDIAKGVERKSYTGVIVPRWETQVGFRVGGKISERRAEVAQQVNRLIDVVARATPTERSAVDRLGDLTISTRNGMSVPLAQLAKQEITSEHPILWRRNGDVILAVRSDVIDGVQGPDVTKEILPKLAVIRSALPVGYRIDLGGAIEESGKADAALFAVMPVMFLIMLTLIMLQLRSFSRTLLVFLTFPLGFIGASFALYLTGLPFGFVALLGVLALGGIIVRNTLILADQIETDMASGLSMRDAIIETTVRRARPVMLKYPTTRRGASTGQTT